MLSEANLKEDYKFKFHWPLIFTSGISSAMNKEDMCLIQ